MQIYLFDIMFPMRYYSLTVRVNQIFHQVELFQEWENVLGSFFLKCNMQLITNANILSELQMYSTSRNVFILIVLILSSCPGMKLDLVWRS